MREILFRGKRVDNGLWVEGCLIHDNAQSRITTNCGIGRYNGEMCECRSYEVYPDSVGQCIGIKDGNNIKVFEGDIIRKGDDEYFVFWDEQSLSWSIQSEDVIYSLGEMYGYEVEVIGKIFDNQDSDGTTK